jgi:hypothetical protein
MPSCDRKARTGRLTLILAATAFATAALCWSAQAETVDSPKFRKGLWRFERTLEYPAHRVVARQEALTRCVDPTHAMRGTFTSPDIGSCRSTKPTRIDNRYSFASRCDYLGPVSTDIVVHSEEAYTEHNSMLNAGKFPKVDRVVAQRVGDCTDGHAAVTVVTTPGKLDTLPDQETSSRAVYRPAKLQKLQASK